MKNPIKQLLRWALKSEIEKLEKTINDNKITNYNLVCHQKRLKGILGDIDVGVDVHLYARSWAVVSIQGQKADYIKFVDLGNREAEEIQRYLSQFDRNNRKADCVPYMTGYLKID